MAGPIGSNPSEAMDHVNAYDKNFSASINSSSGKVIENGREVDTKHAIQNLETVVSAIKKNTFKLSKDEARAVSHVTELLSEQLSKRISGEIKPSIASRISQAYSKGTHNLDLQKRLQDVETTLKPVIEETLKESTQPKDTEKDKAFAAAQKLKADTTKENTVVISRGSEALDEAVSETSSEASSDASTDSVSVSTKEKDPNAFHMNQTLIDERQKQVDRDLDRKLKVGSDILEFPEGTAGSTPKEKLSNLIAGMNEDSKNALIQELHTKLPEGSRTDNAIHDLAPFYGLPQDTDATSIITAQVYLNILPTTLLTSNMSLGSEAQAVLNPDTIVPMVTLQIDSTTGLSRPEITAESSGFPVKTGPFNNLQETHEGSINATCDPIKGTIQGGFAMIPKR